MIGAERSGTTLVMAMLGCPPAHRGAGGGVVLPAIQARTSLRTADLSRDANFRTLAEEMVFGLKTPFWGMKVNLDHPRRDPRRAARSGASPASTARCTSATRARREQAALGREDAAQPLLREGDPRGLPQRAVHLHHARRPRRERRLPRLRVRADQHLLRRRELGAVPERGAPWRKQLATDQWMDLCYEDLVKDPGRRS
jgi:hypothetical protein